MTTHALNLSKTIATDPSLKGAAVLHTLHTDGQEKTPIWIDLRDSDITLRHSDHDCKTDSALLDIRNPITYPVARLPQVFEQVMSLLKDQSVVPALKDATNWSELRNLIAERSEYDGLRFIDMDGCSAWVPASEEQVFYIYKDRANTRIPTYMSINAFIDNFLVSEKATTDGTSEDYDGLWEALANVSEADPVLARLCPYTIRLLPDYQPFGTLGLFDENDAPCGFYMNGHIWIDPKHRTDVLEAQMVRVAGRLLSDSPSDPEYSGVGFSEQDLIAHMNGWAMDASETYFDIDDSFNNIRR